MALTTGSKTSGGSSSWDAWAANCNILVTSLILEKKNKKCYLYDYNIIIVWNNIDKIKNKQSK